MKFVDPIRDIKKISLIKNLLRGENKIRDLLLFELGINSALRLSDLLRIKVLHLFNNMEIKEHFELKEEKTGKTTRITITPKVKDTLAHYKELYPSILKEKDNYIFFHQKVTPLGSKNIGRKQAWQMINNWTKAASLNGNYGGHTLRKTWGYQARKKGIPLELIQHKLNHSSMKVTQRYLGITNEEIEKACNELDL